MIKNCSKAIQFERLYAQLKAQKKSCVAITASEPTEGVTTQAYHLACCAAEHGKRVLIIDFNLSNPKLTEEFNGKFIDQNSLLESINKNIYSADIKNLSFIPAPIDSKFLHPLCDLENLETCFEQLKQSFDFIVVDCSPINSEFSHTIPAEIICKATQGCILVVLAGKTPGNKVKNAIEQLKRMNVNILGGALNDQYNLSLTEMLCKSTNVGDRILPKQMERLRTWILKIPLLNIES